MPTVTPGEESITHMLPASCYSDRAPLVTVGFDVPSRQRKTPS
jgi:hypothetical protein